MLHIVILHVLGTCKHPYFLISLNQGHSDLLSLSVTIYSLFSNLQFVEVYDNSVDASRIFGYNVIY